MRNQPVVPLVLLVVLSGTLLILPRNATAATLGVFESVEPPFVDGPLIYKTQDLAQSFTASMNYTLVRIQAMLHDLQGDVNPIDPLNLSLQTDAGGAPSGTALANASADGPFGYAWVAFDLVPAVSVVGGQMYWIVIEDENGVNPQSGYKWGLKSTDTYPGGSYGVRSGGGNWVTNNTGDLLFETWGYQGPVVIAGMAADTQTAAAGDPIVYSVYLNNTGTQPASFVWANVTLSPNTTYVADSAGSIGGMMIEPFSWLFADVALGAHSFLVEVEVNPGIFDGLPMVASVDMDYTNESLAMQEHTSASVTVIARSPSLTVSKSVNPRYLNPGENLTYTVTIASVGSRSAPWAWLNDTLPPEVVYLGNTANTLGIYVDESFDGTTLRVQFANVTQGVFAFDIRAQARPGLANGTAFTNVAVLEFGNSQGVRWDPSPTAQATARINGASIQAAKAATVAQAEPGATVIFRIRYDNRGNAQARWVWINDTLPPELIYVSDTATPPGILVGSVLRFEFQNVSIGIHSFTVTTLLRDAVPDGTVVTNVIDVSVADWDGRIEAPLSAAAGVLAVRPLVSVTGSAPSTANPGDAWDLRIWVRNAGNATAPSVWVNLTLPAEFTPLFDDAAAHGGIATASGWRFGDVLPGAFSFDVHLRTAAGVANGTALNTTLGGSYADRMGRTFAYPSESLRIFIVAPVMDIALSLSATSVASGETIALSLRYWNLGAGVAATVLINVTLPSGITVVSASRSWVATNGVTYTWREEDVPTGSWDLEVILRADGRSPGPAVISARLDYTDANGHGAGNRTTAASFGVSGAPFGWSPQTWGLLVLLGVVAILSTFIGHRVYGLGARDRGRIEQLFLLHKSGLLIKHYTRQLHGSLDTDILAAMIVAVQNFVRESFRFKAGDLEEMKFGPHKILLLHGQFVILAALVSGRYIDRLKAALQGGIETLESRYGDALKDWDGVVDELAGIDAVLDPVLKGKAPARNGGSGKNGNGRGPPVRP